MGELSKLPNIGKIVEEQLVQVGINTADELAKTGSKEAWLRIREIDESACINRLMALEGAIRGIKKNMLPDEVKADLKAFYQKNKMKWLLNSNYNYETKRSYYSVLDSRVHALEVALNKDLYKFTQVEIENIIKTFNGIV